MKILYQAITKFHNLQVIQEKEIRTLLSGHGMCREQSSINIKDPREHVYDYSFLAMKGLEFIDPPSKILVIGLGGGIIPRELRYRLPYAEIDIIEIDENIIKLAKDFFFFEEDDKMRVYKGDAFIITKEMKNKYDFIVVDAFFSNYIPFPLMSSEFIGQLYELTFDKAILTVNCSCIHPSFNSQINTYRFVFGDNIYKLNGKKNECSTTLYVGKKDAIFPDKIEFTDEIKNAKIFTLLHP